MQMITGKRSVSQGDTVFIIATNGPAVEGVNVGGAIRRLESRYFSHKFVPAASHHGAIFAIMV
jgi:hypothetical protein